MFCVCVFKKENRYYIFFSQFLFPSAKKDRFYTHSHSQSERSCKAFVYVFAWVVYICVWAAILKLFNCHSSLARSLSEITRFYQFWAKLNFAKKNKVLIEFSLTRMATLNNKFCLCDKFSCLFVLFLRRKIIRG